MASNRYTPDESVVVDTPLFDPLVTWTVAPGIAPPPLLLTVPVSAAVVGVWGVVFVG
jgi:hypothetical protein